MSLGGYIRRTVYWAKDYLKGSPIRTHYNDIDFIRNNKVEGDKRINMYLENLLSHATNNSEFYKKYQDLPFEEFPVMNKLSYIENYDSIFIKDRWGQKGSWIARTSGSTGIPFMLHQDKNKRNRLLAELKYFGQLCGYTSHEPMAQFRVWKYGGKTKLQSFNENIFAVDISKLNDETMHDIVNLLINKKITTIFSYSNALDILCRYILDENISSDKFKIKTIVSQGEALQRSTEIALHKIFKCKVIKQYSNNENGIFSEEPSKENFFLLNHASYKFEILKLNSDKQAEFGELGRIVVTDLFNYAFPMIRYDLGDIGVIEKGHDISFSRPILTELHGRHLDLIYNTTGGLVNPLFITAHLQFDFESLMQLQFIQKSHNEYVLKIVLKSTIDLSSILKEIKLVLGFDAQISVEEVTEIPLLPSGKRKFIICEYKHPNYN